MDEPILKAHWERFKTHVDLDISTAAKLLSPIIKDKIEQLELLPEGCSNTNYKVTFKTKHAPVVIRIYVRSKSHLTLSSELAIHQWIENKIPVAEYLYADTLCNIFSYPYAIMEYIDGKLMREVIMGQNEKAIRECAFEAGRYINELRKLTFKESGFFEEGLLVRPFNKEEEYSRFVNDLLHEKRIQHNLGVSLTKKIGHLVKSHGELLLKESNINLTHADYDPANIMVKHIKGRWKIIGILDWEFAFAGTYLFDVGTMLRYSHKLPAYYETAFIEGIQHTGFKLPPHWKQQAKLIDMLSLLTVMQSHSPENSPNVTQDAVSLIEYTVKQWESF